MASDRDLIVFRRRESSSPNRRQVNIELKSEDDASNFDEYDDNEGPDVDAQ